MSVSLSTL